MADGLANAGFSEMDRTKLEALVSRLCRPAGHIAAGVPFLPPACGCRDFEHPEVAGTLAVYAAYGLLTDSEQLAASEIDDNWLCKADC